VRIRVLFFGVLRDIVGLKETSLEVPEGGRLAWVFESYATRFPRLKEMSASIVLARNQQFATPADALSEGDEVAFLPPVSGGLGIFTHEITDEAGNFFALTRDPIDAAALGKRLARGQDGGIVTFQGITRNNTKGRSTRYLEYECYEAMAVKMMAQIGGEIARNFPISRIGMVHRLGRVEIGDASVVIVAAAPHRKPAFDAALEGIDKLKRLVPVWKKEYFADGEVWVEGEWDDSVVKARS
jgi:molybdopterin converting factor subunit 1